MALAVMMAGEMGDAASSSSLERLLVLEDGAQLPRRAIERIERIARTAIEPVLGFVGGARSVAAGDDTRRAEVGEGAR